MPAAREGAVSEAEARILFDALAAEPALVLAVSGGPDSTALLHLMARWRAKLRPAPRLLAVTVDHGLRAEAKGEAAAVKRLAEKLGVEHTTMRWGGDKPSTGIQEAARLARYRLLRTAARRAKARCVVTAHTLDDQAETVLFRLARGSGLAGICGMARQVPLDHLTAGAASARPRAAGAGGDVVLVRPLLDVPKARLIVTLREAGIAYAEDPGNADPRFARARLRGLMPALAGEGLTSRCLARLARRVRRSEAAHEAVVAAAVERLGVGADGGKVVWHSAEWRTLPEEIALRLLGRAVAAIGTEGPVEFGKLESLNEALTAAVRGGATRFRRTLAGAMVSLQKDRIVIVRAPARRGPRYTATPG
ncbi:MAG: tRNA lysidine(34) synthetase TilS [Bradyrhizobiaceae bacterium]|nr:tRNA lysidine(34) synthetase TilS [Bradyrhizobiaceae bacterium]